MKREDESLGIVPISKQNGFWQVFLIQHREGGYWGFPKGHAENNENSLEAAKRELKEETNLDCIRVFQDTPLMEQYHFFFDGVRVFKRVIFFVAEVSGEVCLQEEEIYYGVWLSLSDAMDRLTYPEAKTMLSEVIKMLSNMDQ
jgi:8-oxo-dGTP pyrophosphatase MutT (NUDIX family)